MKNSERYYWRVKALMDEDITAGMAKRNARIAKYTDKYKNRK